MKISGKVSWFGGPDDTGVAPDEGLAFIYELNDKPELFLSTQPAGTTGLARRLNPDRYYVACRWDYQAPYQSKEDLLQYLALVRAPKTGKQFVAYPADWGPNSNTGRVADISPSLMEALGITTDDTVEVVYPFGGEEQPMPTIKKVAISAGHGKKVAGASGYFEENVETPRVMAAVAWQLRDRGVVVSDFWDTTSTTQQQNLDAIVDWHNQQTRDLDVSVHFNASNGQGHGVEVLYVSQEELAAKVSKAIADISSLTDRGAKYNGSLAFLNGTNEPAILIEVCFCDNRSDYDIYNEEFEDICEAIAVAISGVEDAPPIEPPVQAEDLVVEVALKVPSGVDLKLIINGEPVFISDASD